MKTTLSQRFEYWFDTQMSKGTSALIKLLVMITVFAIITITILSAIFGFNSEESAFDILWDSMATIINAWLPYYEDGEGSIGYLIIMTIAAVIGLLITSILIGIISTAIEEHMDGLKEGKSKVLETNHVVVLGFVPGEYTLITQLILASGTNNQCIVICSDMKSEEMKELVLDNVDVPKNIKLIFRTIDIFDPISLDKCSLESCRNVIITPTDDKTTVKVLLAVSHIINSAENEKVRVGALLSKSTYDFPDTVAAKHNVTTIQMHNVIAKIIAHSCTQTGLSDTFREIFNFEGNELYVIDLLDSSCGDFGELSFSMDAAVPVGIIRNGEKILNPGKSFALKDNDRVIVFSENRDSAILRDTVHMDSNYSEYKETNVKNKVAIIGYNESFNIVINELPEHVTDVVVAGFEKKNIEAIKASNSIRDDIRIVVNEIDVRDVRCLLDFVKEVNHVVLLNDYSIDQDDADLDIIFLIMHLRDIRTKNQLDFNITAEMNKKSNQRLIIEDDYIDYVVASNMSSLLLAQLSENPELVDVFDELLSNKGNELYLKKASEFGVDGNITTLELRNITLNNGYVFMGYLKQKDYSSFFNPLLDESFVIEKDDCLILLGEK